MLDTQEIGAKTEKPDSIFTYDNYRLFLKDYFERRRRESKTFSLRFFAAKVGFKSHSYCDKVMRGERNLSLESVLKIGAVMKLAKSEQEYFQYLVLYNQAKNIQEKQDQLMELNRRRRKLKFYRIQEEQYLYFSSWICQVIREAAVFSDWNGNYRRLGQMLIPPVSEKEAEDTVALLVKTGFLKKTVGKKFIQANPIVSAEGCPPHIIKNVRSQLIFKGIEAGENLPKTSRHLSYSTMAISQKTYTSICGLLDEIRRKILDDSLEEENVDDIYSLNFQFYPLTQGLRKGAGKMEGRQ